MPKFEIYNDSKGKFRYRLIADNNQEICTSSAYANISTVKAGIEALSRNAADGVNNVADRSDKVLKAEALAEREIEKAKIKAAKEKEAKRQADIKAKEKAKADAEKAKADAEKAKSEAAKKAKPAAKPKADKKPAK